MKKGLLITVMLMVMLALGACSSGESNEDQWSRIKKDKEVVIGLDDSFVPMGFRDKDDNLVGFDIDLAKAVFAEYGIKAKFTPIDWTMKESELKNGSIDLIWNGYTVTDARKKQVAFSQPYMKNEQVLVTLKSSNINQFSDMKNKTLGAQNGASSIDDMAKKPEVLTDIINNNEPELYDTFDTAFIDLNNKRIDGLIIDEVYARYYIDKQKNKDDYNIITGGFDATDFAVGMRKSDKELQTKINEAFEKLYKEGKMQEISKKWFGDDEIAKQ
ncbi:amino acid ABC transporter substrate-binding protein [Listeria monocytogenes]|uniref:amino acid ABC transporter substrate-binding protein n=1 Tax=Listeria monocytogenes TaxID=1639 RepID=UPI00085BB26F|nr:amino acid ABC transporter substrate-binding protein [Listeria monocytogenes]EEP3930124.1 amino acid ABC transporter substrate-binding protein [Listeria monocytogenes serotype 4ab]AYY71859.1 amino acid ABC transporter substrate-binding protein [Listeria monocytogenes]EAC3818323.1 amino acid ABC transporter substrate-binding protein [Listeria monocytogenes]EAC3818424.1 amino acid ABC transporter substrate-binding protein [Listeria monocytogenes]EAC3920130.1 amino acid ABC transporter substra